MRRSHFREEEEKLRNKIQISMETEMNEEQQAEKHKEEQQRLLQ